MKFNQTLYLLSILFISATAALQGEANNNRNSIRGSRTTGRNTEFVEPTVSSGGGCHNYPDWLDDRGWKYDCEWYEEEPTRCVDFGNGPPGVGNLNANEACCHCGGGYTFPTGPTTVTDGGTKCLTIADGITSERGSNVVMETCDGRESQSWIVEETTSEYTSHPVFLVKSSLNNQDLCLDVDRSGNVISNLHVWDCKCPGCHRYNQEFDLEFFVESRKLLSKSDYCVDWENDMNVIGEDKGNCFLRLSCCPGHIPEFSFVPASVRN